MFRSPKLSPRGSILVFCPKWREHARSVLGIWTQPPSPHLTHSMGRLHHHPHHPSTWHICNRARPLSFGFLFSFFILFLNHTYWLSHIGSKFHWYIVAEAQTPQLHTTFLG